MSLVPYNYYFDYSSKEPEYLLIVWDRGGNSFDYSITECEKFVTEDLCVNPYRIRWLGYRECVYNEVITEQGRIVARSSIYNFNSFNFICVFK